MQRVTLIPGDGTGPEIIEAARRCIDATGAAIDWEIVEAGADATAKTGTPLPDSVLDSIRRSGLALKGPITTPVGSGFRNVNIHLRKVLDLYACLRPCKSYAGAASRYQDVDLVIIRENTEGLYAGAEFKKGADDTRDLIEFIRAKGKGKVNDDSGISIKAISAAASDRIVRFAFDYARANSRRKVTAVHKANIMKMSDGVFLDVAREVAKDYPDVEFEQRMVDNMCMQLVQKPELYDILVLPNLYGDIISDLCAGLVGGPGLAPGANIGAKNAVFEATHGSAAKYRGQNKVNPAALILSGVLMLRHIGEEDAATRLETAVAQVIREGKSVTYDMKPYRDDPTAVGTSEMADAVIAAMG